MPRIIRGAYAQYLMSVAPVVKPGPVNVEDEPLPEEEEDFSSEELSEEELAERDAERERKRLAREEEESRKEEAYRAAYDELVQAAQDEIAAMLDDARRDATNIITEAERGREELRREAWEAGRAEGLADGEREVAAMLDRAGADIQRALSELPAERERMIAELEPQMLDIALEVAEKILKTELERNDAAYVSMLEAAVAKIPAESSVSVRLHPEEYARFYKGRKTFEFSGENGGKIKANIVPDPSIARFGAVIEGAGGAVDAGADAQMAQMSKSFGKTE